MLFYLIPLLILFSTQVWACTLAMFGHFGSYQAVNAMMAEMMGSHGGGWQSFAIPRVFILMNGQPALHLLYYPFGALFARLLQMGCHVSAEWIPVFGKAQSLFLTLVNSGLLYRIAKVYVPKNVALLASALFLFSPMISVTGTSFQNEAAAFFFFLVSFYMLHRKGAPVFVAGFFFGLSIVARIHFAALVIPIVLVLFQTNQNWFRQSILFLSGTFFPLFFWAGYYFTVGRRSELTVVTSLFMQSGEGRMVGLHYLTSSSFWLRLTKQLLIYWAPLTAPLLFFSFNKDSFRKMLPIWSWLAAGFLVIFVLPQKVNDHPFYLATNIPAACILIGVLLADLFSRISPVAKKVFFLAIGCYSIFIFVHIQRLPAEANLWMRQARVIHDMSLPEDKIIVQHTQSAAMLYYTHRLGWGFDIHMNENGVSELAKERLRRDGMTQGYDTIQRLKNLTAHGARYLFITNPGMLSSEPELNKYILTHSAAVSAVSADMRIFDLKVKS